MEGARSWMWQGDWIGGVYRAVVGFSSAAGQNEQLGFRVGCGDLGHAFLEGTFSRQ